MVRWTGGAWVAVAGYWSRDKNTCSSDHTSVSSVMAGGWWLVAGGWWLVAGWEGRKSDIARIVRSIIIWILWHGEVSCSAQCQGSRRPAQDGPQLKRQNTAMTIKLLNFTKLRGISSNGVKMSVWSQPSPSRPTHTQFITGRGTWGSLTGFCVNCKLR